MFSVHEMFWLLTSCQLAWNLLPFGRIVSSFPSKIDERMTFHFSFLANLTRVYNLHRNKQQLMIHHRWRKFVQEKKNSSEQNSLQPELVDILWIWKQFRFISFFLCQHFLWVWKVEKCFERNKIKFEYQWTSIEEKAQL